MQNFITKSKLIKPKNSKKKTQKHKSRVVSGNKNNYIYEPFTFNANFILYVWSKPDRIFHEKIW